MISYVSATIPHDACRSGGQFQIMGFRCLSYGSCLRNLESYQCSLGAGCKPEVADKLPCSFHMLTLRGGTANGHLHPKLLLSPVHH